MKVSIKLAAAGALASITTGAFALTPAEIQQAASNGTLVTLYVSGASASDHALENVFKIDDAAYRICLPGTLDIYYYKIRSGVIWQRALSCTAGFNGVGVFSSTSKLLLLKESAGSSASGISNVAMNTPTLFIDMFNFSNFATACATVSSTGSTLPTGSGAFRTRDCGYVADNLTPSTVSRTNAVPQAGISDLDPATFVGMGDVTSDHVNALSRKYSAVSVTFNPIVSVPMFTALQRAYGYIGATASESTASLSTAPSLRSSTLRAIFNGASVVNANQVNVNGVKLSSQLSGFADQSGDIYICRRSDRAGEMAAVKFHFLSHGCATNPAASVSFVNPDAPQCMEFGCGWETGRYNDYVFAGTSADDVRQCVDYHSSQGRLALGIASTEAKPGLTHPNRYRYIKVDRAEPTLKAVMEGRYSFFTENSFNDKFPSTSASGSQTLWDRVLEAFSNPTSLSHVNRAWRRSMALTGADDGTADTGLLDMAGSWNSTAISNLFLDGRITGAEVRSTPINSQTRTTLDGQANNCNHPYQAYP